MGEQNRIGRFIDADAVSQDDQDAYTALSAQAAKGVAVITAVHGRWDYATTITDHLSISYDPPTMLASLYSLSRIAEAVEESGRWALSFLAAHQVPVADRLSDPGAPLIGLLDQVPHWRLAEGAPALVDGALAWFVLRTTAVHRAATHSLVVGEVTWAGGPAAASAGGLVRCRSGYHRL